MNIYELEKQATAGPFEGGSICGSKALLPNGYLWAPRVIRKDEPANEPVADFFSYRKDRKEWQANLRMFAHCRNNFLKALTMLKYAQHELDLLYAHAINTGICEAGDPPQQQVARAIAELEEIKT